MLEEKTVRECCHTKTNSKMLAVAARTGLFQEFQYLYVRLSCPALDVCSR